MRFIPTDVPGAFLLEQERHGDERGFFARTWCARELSEHGLDPRLSQCSVSFNHRKGTLRGLHYQAPPRAEVKVVRCTRGAIYDVAVDLRPDSPGFRRWVGIELTPENGRALYIPRGFAHGFLTLADATEVAYDISEEYSPAHARGVRFDDPFLRVAWPAAVEIIAARDRDYPDVAPERLEELRGLASP
ncbi:MAG TPA: dTDP-4-dehydrorhamnose 3,5-epimerase [Anaeromyxobacter sp.]